jgi:hypothetical protein
MSALNIFSFWSSKPWIRNWIRISNYKKCWIRIRIKSVRIRNRTGTVWSTAENRQVPIVRYPSGMLRHSIVNLLQLKGAALVCFVNFTLLPY